MNLAFLAFLVSVVVSLLSFTLIASWYVVPRLSKQPYVQALLPLAHCLMAKSYFGRRGCLMNNLTLLSSSDPLTHRIWVINSWHMLLSKTFLCKRRSPETSGSLRGHAPQRGSRGLAPWPQRSAQPALARRDGESFRER